MRVEVGRGREDELDVGEQGGEQGAVGQEDSELGEE